MKNKTDLFIVTCSYCKRMRHSNGNDGCDCVEGIIEFKRKEEVERKQKLSNKLNNKKRKGMKSYDINNLEIKHRRR